MNPAAHRFGQRWAERFAAVRRRLVRVRHFRGHGIHSPFVYSLVREVFMRSAMMPGDRTLFRALREAGVAERSAVQLQNLAIREGYRAFGLNRAEGELYVALRELPQAEVLALAARAAVSGAAVAVLEPSRGRERQALCRRLVAEHRSTSVDNRACLLLFNNRLPKQHFVL